ncbi:ABC transporter permease [Kitasatospora sp. NBC_00085]|uniref:ABC transporter permease n=1 Tax=unclassified Kitasatospora TaxID=2633591 RepID=UPI003252339B
MNSRIRLRGRIEALLAVVSVLVITLVWPAWIESVFGIDPDQHSGALEWIIVAIAFCATAAFSLLARSEWRRPRTLRTE